MDIFLVVSSFFSFFFSSGSFSTATTFQAERRHPSSECCPPILRLARPQVDVREASTQAPGRTTTGHLCETKKKKKEFAVSIVSEPRNDARGGDLDQIYSFRPGLFHRNCTGEGKVGPHFSGLGGTSLFTSLLLCVLLLCRPLQSICRPSQSTTARHYLHPFTPVCPAHENDQAPLT